MRRRAFVGVLSGAAAWPSAVLSQPKRTSRIGFLGLTSPVTHARLLNAFRRGLNDLGYVEGQNIILEYRWAEGRYDRLPQLATDLSQANVELVVAYGSEGALAAKRSITTLPVVAVSVGDFIGAGIVSNLARPPRPQRNRVCGSWEYRDQSRFAHGQYGRLPTLAADP